MPRLEDPYDLQRFADAQDRVYERVCAELRNARKTGHWMWFIFPQIRGLGSSVLGAEFAISSLGGRRPCLQHPILGSPLVECTRLINFVKGHPIDQILAYPGNLKFRSAMTLFAQATTNNQVFMDALQRYFGGKPDPAPLERL